MSELKSKVFNLKEKHTKEVWEIIATRYYERAIKISMLINQRKYVFKDRAHYNRLIILQTRIALQIMTRINASSVPENFKSGGIMHTGSEEVIIKK